MSENESNRTVTAKISEEKKIEETKEETKEEKTEVDLEKLPKSILLLGGSFSPVHKGHVELLLSLRDYFQSNKQFHVIAAYLVLTTDKYIWGKLNEHGITFDHRQKMCEIAIKEYGKKAENFVFASHIPCLNASHYGYVIASAENAHKFFIETKLLQDESQLSQLYHLNCCGGDKLLLDDKTGLWRYIYHSFFFFFCKNVKTGGGSEYSKLVSIGRSGYTETVRELYNKDKANKLVNEDKFLFVDMELDEVSSTQIRTELFKFHQAPVESRTSELKQQIITTLQNKISAAELEYAFENVDRLWLQESDFIKSKPEPQATTVEKPTKKKWFAKWRS
ncbi:hypothetical protein RFI_15109 [Reticulomyxa filosa]|uniref:Cytidyltransferase-like domain-containing protein n=1 Tax=Reticulomyxa filosa TaxID=46433 RepID=X6N847_RETFI|nr:hypothetical protein RFI_15109 [Reticulomyxa filosa]|eukprot:ETO22093.1 hypothetical protein RFI_15109 [Reticulomyxa filosa]